MIPRWNISDINFIEFQLAYIFWFPIRYVLWISIITYTHTRYNDTGTQKAIFAFLTNIDGFPTGITIPLGCSTKMLPGKSSKKQ